MGTNLVRFEPNPQATQRTAPVQRRNFGLAARILDHLAPERGDRFDPDAFTRRELHTAIDSTGMLVGTFQLDPAAATIVKTALDVYSKPDPACHGVTPDGQEALVGDDRTPAQRRADALATIARLALTADHDEAPSGPLTHITIIATPEQVAAARNHRAGTDGTNGQGSDPEDTGGPVPAAFAAAGAEPAPGAPVVGMAECVQTGPLPAGVFTRLGCDALLQAVILSTSGAVLNLGRAVRTVSAAQRKALTARDQGCVVPGCTAPLAACDAHHVKWWRHGGPTDLHNLVLLCGAQLSRPGARCRDCSRSVSPSRSPNPPCVSPRNGLSTVCVVRRGRWWARGWGWSRASGSGSRVSSRSSAARSRPTRAVATCRCWWCAVVGCPSTSSGGVP